MGVSAKAGDFKAWINKQPGSDGKLIVEGTVTVPSGGYSGSLVEAEPQGINPKILILDAVIVPPGGVATDVITPLKLRFEKPRSPDYESVTIRRLGADFTIPVETAH